jgi:hypothetical protein
MLLFSGKAAPYAGSNGTNPARKSLMADRATSTKG